MTWSYRGMVDREGNHTIREVYYGDDGTIDSFGVSGAAPFGETEEDLVADLTLMLEGLKKPFLVESDFVSEDVEEETIIVDDGKPEALH